VLPAWVDLTFGPREYSYLVLMPVLAVGLVYLRRDAVFAEVRYAPRSAIPVLAAGLAVAWLWQAGAVTKEPERLALAMLAVVTLLTGAFLLCYGTRAVRAAAFGLFFLFLAVPVPLVLMDEFIVFLQRTSAEASDVLFGVLGVPVLREGFVFVLPGLAIEVAKECSGIRSTQAIVITSLLAGHLYLRSVWTRAALVVSVIPLAIVKNAIRIVLLTWLAVYVDRGFMDGALHRYGGKPFFVAELGVMAGFVWALRVVERRWTGASALPEDPQRQENRGSGR
jgi:exosortase